MTEVTPTPSNFDSFTTGRPRSEWTQREERILTELGFTGERLTMFKMCKTGPDGRSYSQRSQVCSYGCRETVWVPGSEVIEEHSQREEIGEAGLYAFAFTPEKTKNVLKRSYITSSWSLVLVELHQDRFIQLIKNEFGDETFTKASGYKVLDDTKDIPADLPLIGINHATSIQIGQHAQSWNEVYEVIRQS